MYYDILDSEENIAQSSTITVSSQFGDSGIWTKDHLVDGVSLLNEAPDNDKEQKHCFHSEVSHSHVCNKQSELVLIYESTLWMSAIPGYLNLVKEMM